MILESTATALGNQPSRRRWGRGKIPDSLDVNGERRTHDIWTTSEGLTVHIGLRSLIQKSRQDLLDPK